MKTNRGNAARRPLKRIAAVSVLTVLCIGALICGVWYAMRCRERAALSVLLAGLAAGTENDKSVIVAVLDSGLDAGVPGTGEDSDPDGVRADFRQRLAEGGYDFTEGTEELTDPYGHGTLVASLILSNTPESVRILPLRVADGEGRADIDTVCRAAVYAAEKGADIINLSLNTAVLPGGEGIGKLEEVIAKLRKQGILTVVSAGNMGNHVKHFLPACLEEAVVVAAAKEDLSPCAFSNYGDTVDFCSLGRYGGCKGTSFAAGYVTAALASLRAYGQEDAESILKRCAVSAAKKKFSPYFGSGYVWADHFVTEGQGSDGYPVRKNSMLCSNPDEYDLGMDILDMEWKDMERERLENILTETDGAYVGMLLSVLDEEDCRELERKAPILHSRYFSGKMERQKGEEGFETVEKTEYDYAEFCMAEYLREREELKTSAWLFRSDETTFWLRCGSGYAIYRIKGLADGNISDPQTGISGRLEWGCLDNGIGEMILPGINAITFYIAGIGAYMTEYGYKRNGVFEPLRELTDVHMEYADKAWTDAASIYYGVNIRFGEYKYRRTGYHLSSSHIRTYYRGTYRSDTDSGDAAYSYNHAYNKYGQFVYGTTGSYVVNKEDCLRENVDSNFNRLISGLTAVVHYANGVKEELPFPVSRVSSRDGFSNKDGDILQMNCENMHFPGTALYESELDVTVVETDPAEYVLMPVPDTYAVKVHANGGKITNNYPEGGGSSTSSYFSVNYDSDRNDNIGGLSIQREGYEFLGWYTAGGEKIYDEKGRAVKNTSCWNNKGVWKKSYSDYEAYENGDVNLDLYARWKVHDYAVMLNADGGMITNNYIEHPDLTGVHSSAARIRVTYDSDLNNRIGSLDVQREGYTFLGWYTSGGEKVYDAGGAAVKNSSLWNSAGKWKKPFEDYQAYAAGRTNLELYAHWEPHQYALKLYGNGGTLTDSYFPVEYDSGLNNSIGGSGVRREGYQFMGWYTESGSGEAVYDKNGAAVKNGSYWNGSGKWKKVFDDPLAYQNGRVNLALYAHWNPNRYTLHFEGNGAGSGAMADMVCIYDQVFQMPENKFQKTGYVFDGWSMVRDGAQNYSDRQQNLKNLTADDGAVITLYARWKDITPPTVREETDTSLIPRDPASTASEICYGWTPRNIFLKFSAEDLGSGMASITLYDGRGTGGSVLASAVNRIAYTVSREGEFTYTLAARDKAGNTAIVYITTRIDYTTPRGTLTVTYNGYRMNILVDRIIEQNERYPGNKASGCREAWAVLKGIDEDGRVIVTEQKPLALKTPGNLFTGAAFEGSYDLSDSFNFDAETIQIEAYVRDIAGNDLPASGTETVCAFLLDGQVKRSLGDAESWKKGETGTVYVTAGAYVDRVQIGYPDAWIAADQDKALPVYQNLAERGFDFSAQREYLKNETDSFFIPLYAGDGEYSIVVRAWKGGHEKRIELPVRSAGSVLEEIRTRLR